MSEDDEDFLMYEEDVSNLYSHVPAKRSGSTTGLNPPSPSRTQIRALQHIQVPDRVPTPMDFSKFRESGELSDIIVTVEGHEFNLHKFPLYTRSDFFRALARSESGKVVLDEFPGGAETFEMVANYCYNKRIDVTKENICRIRCAAEFLQMCSPGNLSDCADRYLIDVLTTAKLSRDMGVILTLILSCRPLGAIAEQANIIDRCVNSIVDCWLLSSKWTRRAPSDRMVVESPSFQRLRKLPLGWFKHLFVVSRDKNVRGSLLGKLIEMYVMHQIKKRQSAEQPEPKADDGATRSADASPTPDDNSTEAASDQSSDRDQTEDKNSDKGKSQNLSEDGASDGDGLEKEPTEEKREEDDFQEEDVDLALVMDTLLLELPERTQLTETLDPNQVATMLKVADELQCQCRGMLLKLAGRILFRFNPTDLTDISPDLLQEIVKEASKDPVQVDPDSVCTVVDGYLLELAEKDKLDVDVFNKMSAAVPNDHRQSHDVLFKVLEKLLKSDTKIADNEKERLLDSVDFRRLSESVLQNAYDSKLVPDPYVTKAALALCAKLRAELETARNIIRVQEEELDKFGMASGRGSTWRHGVETDYGLMTSPPEEEPEVYENDDIPTHKYTDDLDLESFRYSPPGVDPILEKALGGRYYDDPFHIDSLYPYCFHHVSSRSYYDDSDLGTVDHVTSTYHRGFSPRYRSSYLKGISRSSKW